MAGARRSRGGASARGVARVQRGHLQPSDAGGAGQDRPLLPDPVWAALVGGHGELLYGSRLGRHRAGRRGRGRALGLLHPRADPSPGAAARRVLHTHMPYASTLARLEEPELLPIGQTEIGFLDKVAYDHDYTGVALDPSE